MKLDKLAKQLRRDLAANPKKAAALGLMALVALYFWAPLVWHWVSPEGGKKSAQASALILTDDPEEPAVAAKRRAVKFRWEKVRDLAAKDSLMASAAFDGKWTDPFPGHAPSETKTTTTPAAGAQRAVAAADFDPTQAGLVLSGVMIVGKRRTATINGDTYQEGSVIKLGSEAELEAVELRVVKIASQGVVLQRGGKTYSLRFAKPSLARGDAIERTGTKRQD